LKIFDNTTALAAATLTAGQIVQTKGYSLAGDGGGATYLIKTAVDYAGTPDEYGDHTLAGGTIAVLQTEGSVNVKQFGATGDGVTDDTAAIQAALDSGAETVRIPDGTYLHSGLSHTGGNLHLRGVNATLQYTGATHAFLVSTALDTNASGFSAKGITFKNGQSCLKLDGDGTGIYSDIHIEDCTFDTSTSGMLWFEQCKNTKILGNVFKDAQDNGIYYAFSRDAVIANNIVQNCSGSGSITVGYSNTNVTAQNILIEGNEIFTDASAPVATIAYIAGITVVYAQNILVRNNHISNSTDSVSGRQIKSGINVEEGPIDSVTISGNKVSNMPEEGLRVGTASNSKISNLTVTENHFRGIRQGITLERTYNSTLSNNTIERTRTWGIFLSFDGNPSGVSIIGNIFQDCNIQGTNANGSCIGTYAVNTFITNNTFVDSQTGGTLASSAGAPTYSVDGVNVLTLYESAVAVDTIDTTGLSWTEIKTAVELNAGWTLTLFADCGDYVPFALRRSGIRYDASINQWSLPSVITTPEASGYIYTHSLSAGSVLQGNRHKTNTMELPNHHNNNVLYTVVSGVISDSSFTGAREFYGSAAPTSGYYVRGDKVYDDTPSASGTMGWVCVTAGSPGTWKTFGAISA